MKLNLGAASQKIEGFTGVDISGEADITHDLREPLPFDNDSVEEILAIHLIESFYKWEFPPVLADWYRVMKERAKLTIEFTVLSDTIGMYMSDDDKIRQWGKWGLYGNQDTKIDPIVLHHYVYEQAELEARLKEAGFTSITFTGEGINHVAGRDMRVICNK